MSMQRVHVVLPAAGSGLRMQQSLPKQYLEVDGSSLLEHALRRLGDLPEVSRVVVVLAPGDQRWAAVAARLSPGLRSKLVLADGGASRAQSVLSGLRKLREMAAPQDWVLVHDAVRPCVHATDVRNLMRAAQDTGVGALLAVAVRETLKESADGRMVTRTVDRARYWHAATPQLFPLELLQRALEQALASGHEVTDEAAAVEALGFPVQLVASRTDNIKVTWPGDLALVAAILRAQREAN